MKGFCRRTMKITDITLDVGVNGCLLKCSACGIIRLRDASHHIGLPDWLAEDLQGVERQFRAAQALELWQRWFLEDGNPLYAGECGGELHCFFCGEYQVRRDSNEHDDEDCIFVAAKRLVEQAACTAAIERDTHEAEA